MKSIFTHSLKMLDTPTIMLGAPSNTRPWLCSSNEHQIVGSQAYLSPFFPFCTPTFFIYFCGINCLFHPKDILEETWKLFTSQGERVVKLTNWLNEMVKEGVKKNMVDRDIERGWGRVEERGDWKGEKEWEG